MLSLWVWDVDSKLPIIRGIVFVYLFKYLMNIVGMILNSFWSKRISLKKMGFSNVNWSEITQCRVK
jgi:hypothetical protein